MRKDQSVKLNVDLPTFASVARARGSSQLKRPNCLNFQTKDNVKRIDLSKFLKHISYPVTKLVDSADMKSKSTDIICKTSE